ncbi:MAG: hypothetical protein KDJ15_06725 [Alphaproteobacteria bacterium]|nr:hypothetical protein [Alphaproteobacteria bacterium]
MQPIIRDQFTGAAANPVKAEQLIPPNEIQATLVSAVNHQEWDPKFAPPEGQEGMGGADQGTELAGFKRDFMETGGPLQNILSQFTSGGTPTDIGHALTRMAYRQQSQSAGSFTREMALILRDRIAPDYLATMAETQVHPVTTADIVKALRKGGNEPVMEELDKRVNDKTEPGDIPKLLQQIDIYFEDIGDDDLSEAANKMRQNASTLLAEEQEARTQSVQTIAAQWRHEEGESGQPLREFLNAAPAGTPGAMAPRRLN